MTANAWFEGFSIWCQREMMIDCELVPFYIRKKDLGHGSLPSFSAYFWVFFTVLFYARIFGRRVGNPGMDISNNAVSSRTKAGGMACASLNTTVGVCLLLAELPPSIGTTSEYRHPLRVSATPPSIGPTSEYRTHLRKRLLSWPFHCAPFRVPFRESAVGKLKLTLFCSRSAACGRIKKNLSGPRSTTITAGGLESVY